MERAGGKVARISSCDDSSDGGSAVQSSVSQMRGIKTNALTHNWWTFFECGKGWKGSGTFSKLFCGGGGR